MNPSAIGVGEGDIMTVSWQDIGADKLAPVSSIQSLLEVAQPANSGFERALVKL